MSYTSKVGLTPTIVKRHLDINEEETEWDPTIYDLIEETEAWIEHNIGVPFESTAFTQDFSGVVREMLLARAPASGIVVSDLLILTDGQPTVIDGSSNYYSVDARTGIVAWSQDWWRHWGGSSTTARYRVAYNAGLALRPDWESLQVTLRRAVRRIVCRTFLAQTRGEDKDIESLIPDDVWDTLNRLRVNV